ncbi:Antitermination domain-containing isoform 2 [Olea europaea subsp. europaea]|uniref:Antitermination domain-containing isoform 2 n=1 Tax=Olea europaea subsp. europaea TaxID=158383 RepID=A0A8S0PCI5_OLEEU|nr:Antitermination domain-containing isoform 2 [Olea europaea subsp. europaea]
MIIDLKVITKTIEILITHHEFFLFLFFVIYLFIFSQDEPAGRILELSILHLAMSEITVLGTRHQIVINEAVDLAKRFCDGAAPRVINGCLRTFMKDVKGNVNARELKIKETVLS